MTCSVCGKENTHESWCKELDPKAPPKKESPIEVSQQTLPPKEEKITWGERWGAFLCAIGWHDYVPAGGPWGMGMGWSSGSPCACSRCGKGGTFSDFGVY